MATPHFRTCPLCEATCGLRIEVEDGRVTSIRGDQADPFSRGFMCPKAPALRELHEDPNRLRAPRRRTKGGWQDMGWDDALDFAAEGIHRVQSEHGRDAIAMYIGNPTVHNFGAVTFGVQFLRTLRTKHRYSATSCDQLPTMFAAREMFGHQLLIPVPDVDRTDHLLMLGANPVVSGGSLMTAPGMRQRIDAIRARGGRVVVIDPRHTETAAVASEHVFVRPGSDALLLLALLQTIFEDKLERDSAVMSLCDRGQALRDLVAAYPPERVAEPTGIDAASIRRIARAFARAERAVAYGRIGTSTQMFGALANWLINALNIVTGNLDRVGGAMFTKPAFDLVDSPDWLSVGPGSFGRWSSTVRGLPEFGGELPVATLAEDILDERQPIRGLVVFAGNPVLSTPNGVQVDRALSKLEHMVAVDFYVNETSRHADVILPPVSALERPHYDVALYSFAVRNVAKYAPPLFEAAPGARQDWQILLGLQRRMHALRGDRSLAVRAKLEAMQRLGPEGILDLALRLGPYGVGVLPPRAGLSLRKLKRHPHGLDLGPLQPALPGRLPAGRRIDLAPEVLVADLARLDAHFFAAPADNATPFTLIGRRLLRSNNSWMHNLPKLVAGKPTCTLQMNPVDAQRLDLAEGTDVTVRSRVGAVTVPLRITDDLMPGVVSLPHGFGHDRERAELDVARGRPGASLNDLTDELAIDALSGNAALSGLPVTVQRAP